MKLRRRQDPPQSETIIALIDVVFFLLVFFMLIGRMDATAPFDVTPPVAISGQDLPAGGATLSIGRNGATAMNGAEIARDDIQRAISTLIQEDPELQLRINAHREVDLRHVLPLIGQAETLGAKDIVLVVTPAGPANLP